MRELFFIEMRCVSGGDGKSQPAPTGPSKDDTGDKEKPKLREEVQELDNGFSDFVNAAATGICGIYTKGVGGAVVCAAVGTAAGKVANEIANAKDLPPLPNLGFH